MTVTMAMGLRPGRRSFGLLLVVVGVVLHLLAPVVALPSAGVRGSDHNAATDSSHLVRRYPDTPVKTIPLRANVRDPSSSAKQHRSIGGETAIDGCPWRDFSALVTIGSGAAAQSFELIVDTGSSTLAVASDLCSSCMAAVVSPVYNTSEHLQSGAIELPLFAHGSYVDQSGWSGYIWIDTVEMGDIVLQNYKIVAMTDDIGFFHGDCIGNWPSHNQGIIGMGYAHEAVSSHNVYTDAFPDSVEQSSSGTLPGQAEMTPLGLDFTMLMCADRGLMWISGYDRDYVSSPTYYVPIVIPDNILNIDYTININAVHLINGSSHAVIATASSSASDFPSGAFVDSGSTDFLAPGPVYDALIASLNTSESFLSYFGHEFFPSGGVCYRSIDVNMTMDDFIANMTAEFNEILPWLQITLDGGVVLRMPPAQSYLSLRPQENNTICVFSGLSRSPDSSTVILGWSILNHFVVTYDRSSTLYPYGAIGWATTSSCPGATPATILQTNDDDVPSSTPTATTPSLAPSTTPTTPFANNNDNNNNNTTSSSAGAIAGGVIASVGGVAIIVALAVWYLRSRQDKHRASILAAAGLHPDLSPSADASTLTTNPIVLQSFMNSSSGGQGDGLEV